jgi:flagellar biosynthetic protein FliQ
MSPEQITEIMRHTLFFTIEIAAPFLLVILVVGFLISALQHVMHIQEMTLTFVPKMLILSISLAIFFPWIMKMMIKFTHEILINQWDRVVTTYVCS